MVVGSDLIQQTVDRWFNVDVERILSSSQALGTACASRWPTAAASTRAPWPARSKARGLLDPAGQGRPAARRWRLRARELQHRHGQRASPRRASCWPSWTRACPRRDAGAVRRRRWPRRALAGRRRRPPCPSRAASWLRVAVPVRDAQGAVRGAVIVSTLHARRRWPRRRARCRSATRSSARRRASRSPSRPSTSRSTCSRPCSSCSARSGSPSTWPAASPPRCAWWRRARSASPPASAACAWTSRPATTSSPPSSPPSTACRSGWPAARRRSSTRAPGLTRKNQELEERRRLMETVLETVGTGRRGGGRGGHDHRAQRRRLPPARRGRRPRGPLARRTPSPGPGRDEIVGPRAAPALRAAATRQEREVVRARPRPRPAPGRDGGAAAGRRRARRRARSSVLDDLTPLMRAQKVAAWGEVARKLAHEIKNPLTPIQLSAQRMRKAYLKGAPDFEKVLTECTEAIVQRGGGAQEPGGRVRAVRAPARRQPGARARCTRSSSRRCPSTTGSSPGVHIERRLARGRARAAPRRRPDEARAHQPRGQRDRGHGQAGHGDDLHRVRPLAGPRAAGRGRRRPRHPARGPRQALRAALLDQEARAAAWAWPSSAASCRSTTASSGWRTTARTARGSWWSCRHETRARRRQRLPEVGDNACVNRSWS